MALFNKRVKTIVHHEYELTSPVHISEVGKAIDSARADMKRELGNDHADELLQIEARDDKVVITWWSEGEEPG